MSAWGGHKRGEGVERNYHANPTAPKTAPELKGEKRENLIKSCMSADKMRENYKLFSFPKCQHQRGRLLCNMQCCGRRPVTSCAETYNEQWTSWADFGTFFQKPSFLGLKWGNKNILKNNLNIFIC